MIRGSFENQALHLLTPTVIVVMQTATTARISIALAVRTNWARSRMSASRRLILTQARELS